MGMLLIFGGTTEGRQAAQEARSRGEDVLVCVTSAYARALLPNGICCHVGALGPEEMLDFIRVRRPERIVDATHPYALRATENIRRCAEILGLPCERIVRPQAAGGWREAAEWVGDAQGAARALLRTEGNVLLTTGSHTLDVYAACVDPARLYARVLPTPSALETCRKAGVPSSHVIAMQGPFSAALNAALYDQLAIRAMVSKDSGTAGGVEEKVLPALARDIHVILIRRPKEAEDAR